MSPEPSATHLGPSRHARGEHLVECLHALYTISDHCVDVDCDGECLEWMRDHAREALDILLGDAWSYRDLERVITDLRRSHA